MPSCGARPRYGARNPKVEGLQREQERLNQLLAGVEKLRSKPDFGRGASYNEPDEEPHTRTQPAARQTERDHLPSSSSLRAVGGMPREAMEYAARKVAKSYSAR